jgi:hypothetical protein
LLLLQGLGGNSLHWGEGFLSALEDMFELVLYDHRGAGRSGPLTGNARSPERAGHMFFWEQPEHSAQLVREHVAAAAQAS